MNKQSSRLGTGETGGLGVRELHIEMFYNEQTTI